MSKENVIFFEILVRYLLILISAFSNLSIFYILFTPLTVHGAYFLFNLFFSSSFYGSYIFLGEEVSIHIIPACVGGAAYFLLFIMNMSIPKMNVMKRISIILVSFLSFFVINILRIFFLGVFYYNDFPFFDLLHKIIWYVGSIFLTTGIWFLEVYLFKIKEIPFYSDLKLVYKKSLFSKK